MRAFGLRLRRSEKRAVVDFLLMERLTLSALFLRRLRALLLRSRRAGQAEPVQYQQGPLKATAGAAMVWQRRFGLAVLAAKAVWFGDRIDAP